MTGQEPSVAYLHIPSDYWERLGRLRWSADGEALETGDGATVAVLDEVLQILEGAFAGPAAPPFAYVVALLYAIKGRAGESGFLRGSTWDRLREAYHAARGAEGRSRNTGLLIAELCRGLPGLGPPFPIRDAVALARLRRRPKPHEPGPSPPLAPDALLARVAEAPQRFEPADLVHWFRNGCGPVAAGEQLAEPVQSLAQRVAQLVALARRLPRLVGAASLVPAFDAALTLPPRRRSRSELPQGGYADVSTRGDLGRLLPSQLALDPDDFIRRFAEHELLFFEREEPRAARTPDRVLVLDQGVRTWGGVRLGLAGAALALLTRAPKYGGATRLVTTGDAIDWTQTDPARIADVLQASDLSETPAAVLRTVLGEAGPPVGRDIVLLTHPRTLGERAVLEACRTKGPADRLFYLTLDAPGRAELGEWATTGPVPVRSFQVDLTAAETLVVAAAPRPQPAAVAAHPASWTGEVELFPFPFRPGLVAEPVLLGFSADGDVCVAVSRSGIPHAIRTDGSAVEVLPRAYRGGKILFKQVEAILGVTNGVVLCGRVTVTVPTANVTTPTAGLTLSELATVHYDFGRRELNVRFLGLARGSVDWHAYGDLNCIVLRFRDPEDPGRAVDLETREEYFGREETPAGPRVRTAWERAKTVGSSPHNLAANPPGRPGLKQEGSSLRVTDADPPWDVFTPLSDGEPILARERLTLAQLAGNVLALGLFSHGRQSLLICRGPAGAVLSYGLRLDGTFQFALSPRGDRIAYRRDRYDVRVADTASAAQELAAAGPARLHNTVRLGLTENPFELIVGVGGVDHRFTVEDGKLCHRLARPVTLPPAGRPDERLAAMTGYDTARFVPAEAVTRDRLVAVLDRLGQVLLTTRTGEIVAAFLVRRGKAAAWIPAGVFWGEAALIGSGPSPHAEEKIGRAILAHSGQGS